jgi:hypothetical protein
MTITSEIKVDMKPVEQILAEKGLLPGGDVQRFHTANVMRRLQKYMPYRTGATIKIMVAQTDVSTGLIVLNVPYGRYLYYGKAMEGPAPKVVTSRPLQYTVTKNPLAGPFWDRALKANEMPAMQADLQAYVDRRVGNE